MTISYHYVVYLQYRTFATFLHSGHIAIPVGYYELPFQIVIIQNIISQLVGRDPKRMAVLF